jgi:glycosyltransferase involved in cell wall biosynthesis
MTEISIIIPTFNSAKTLAVCLDSILKQSFTDFEVLIMDGLSTDNTLEIVKSYDDIRLIISSEKDNGIYDAMNIGITKAKGTWLYFMGSDDFLYESTTIEQFLNSAELKNNEIVYGNVYSTRFNGIYDGLFSYSKLMNQNICHQAIFFRKSIFTKIGNFNAKYIAHADWDHNIRWFFSSKISKTYVNLIIANYADGGFSSIHNDEVFTRDKNFLLLLKGIGKLSVSELLSCCNCTINFAEQEKDYIRLHISYILRFVLKIYRKIGFIRSRLINKNNK